MSNTRTVMELGELLAQLERDRSHELSDGERTRLERVLHAHPALKVQYERWHRDLDQLADLDPASDEVGEDRSIAEVLTQYQALTQAGHAGGHARADWSARELLGRLPRWNLAAAACAAALALAIGLRWTPGGLGQHAATETEAAGRGEQSTTQAVLLRTGMIHAGGQLGHGQRLAAGARLPENVTLHVGDTPALLQAADQSTVLASAASELRYAPAGAGVGSKTNARWHLTRGSVSAKVTPRSAGQSFVVETEELTARVVGTEFSVQRSQATSPSAAAQYQSVVSVSEGVVEVTSKLSGAVQRVSAGQRVAVPAGTAPVAGDSQGGDGDSAPTATPKLSDIRQHIRQGDVQAARKLIQRARSSGGADAAELGLVEAEADLAEGRYGSAVTRYLGVTRAYPNRPQAEIALFAAAQLSLDHGNRDPSLLKQYLTRYPRGQFAREANALLKAVQKNGRSVE